MDDVTTHEILFFVLITNVSVNVDRKVDQNRLKDYTCERLIMILKVLHIVLQLLSYSKQLFVFSHFKGINKKYSCSADKKCMCMFYKIYLYDFLCLYLYDIFYPLLSL